MFVPMNRLRIGNRNILVNKNYAVEEKMGSFIFKIIADLLFLVRK